MIIFTIIFPKEIEAMAAVTQVHEIIKLSSTISSISILLPLSLYYDPDSHYSGMSSFSPSCKSCPNFGMHTGTWRKS